MKKKNKSKLPVINRHRTVKKFVPDKQPKRTKDMKTVDKPKKK